MKKLLLLLMMVLPGATFAATNPVSVNLGGTTFVLPLQKVQAVQLYSLNDKKGYPGVETVLASWRKDTIHVTAGAAPVLGTSKDVPFASLTFRLPSRFFDTSNNTIMFGGFIGKESGKPHATYGLSATIALW
jgi:hypothetical protein